MRYNRTTRILTITLLGIAASACSRDEPSTAQAVVASAPAHSVATPTAEKKKPTACALVTASEMSTILGSAVQAEPHEGTVDKTECIYKPADAPSPYVELTIEWGEGESAMSAMGTMANAEPGITNPYAGIGDQAAAVGTALMIRTGKDLVTITFSGVDDAPAKAKQIFTTAKAKM